jgi:Flp pilus assembly pilin Flp
VRARPERAGARALNSIGQRLRDLDSDDGLAITEYGLLVAFVCLALIAVVSVFGGQISSWFERKTGTITTV